MNCWDEDETDKRCLHQLHRTKVSLYNELRPVGCGDCGTCIPCADNINCSQYVPIKLVIIYVKERKK